MRLTQEQREERHRTKVVHDKKWEGAVYKGEMQDDQPHGQGS